MNPKKKDAKSDEADQNQPRFAFALGFDELCSWIKDAGKAKPVRLELPKTDYSAKVKAIEAHGQTRAKQWLHEYLKLQRDDAAALMQHLLPTLCRFGLHYSGHESRSLCGGVALALALREGVYNHIVAPDGTPRFENRAAFIAAFVNQFGLADQQDQISRLIRTADLWALLVEGGLPVPQKLSRLKPLITVPGIKTQVWLYESLVKEAGGDVPALQEITAAVQYFKLKTVQDRRAWVEVLYEEATKIERELNSPQPNLDKLAARFRYVVQVLKQRSKPAAKKKRQGVAKASPEAPPGEPPKECPAKLSEDAGVLHLAIRTQEGELIALFDRLAEDMHWKKDGSDQWVFELPKGLSAANAVRHRMREWVSGIMEQLGFALPEPIRKAA